MAEETVPGPAERPAGERPAAAWPICYHRDAFIPFEEARLHANSLALRYALSVFEGIRLYEQRGGGVRPFRLVAHLERLGRSLELMRLPAPEADFDAVINGLIERNRIAEDSYVRLSVSAENYGALATPAVTCATVTAVRMGRKPWLAEDRAMRLSISAWQRTPELSFPAAAKNISNYAGPRLAQLEARAAGYDGVVLTTADGFLCEAPTAALFLVRDGRLATPPLSDGVLPSITRAEILDLCAELGISAEEKRLTRTDAWTADEAFLCGTGIELAPIAEFDSHRLRHAAERPLTRRLVEAYFECARGGGVEGGGAAGGSEKP